MIKEIAGSLLITVIASVFYLNVTGAISVIEFIALWLFVAIASLAVGYISVKTA